MRCCCRHVASGRVYFAAVSLFWALHYTSNQHLQRHTKMLSSQTLFKTPPGGRGEHLFNKPSTIIPSEKVKVNKGK